MSAHSALDRPPRLLLRFALYSAAAILLAGLGILGVVRHQAKGRGERDVRERAALAATLAEHHLRAADFARPVSSARARQLDEALAKLATGDVLRIKLWSRDGRVVYSTDHSLIGSRFALDEAEEVLAGARIVEVGNLNDEGGSGPNPKTVSAYVPARVESADKPVGVLELYADYGEVSAEVSSAVKSVAIALGLALLLLWGTLLPILRRVTDALEARNRSLSDALEEQRRAVAGRAEAEARYRGLVEQLPLVTYVDNLDWTSSAIYISPQAEDLLGYPTIAWLADPEFFAKILHPEDRERVLERHRESYAAGESFDDEYRLVAADGRTVWVQDHVMVVKNPAGKPTHAQGFLLDVTERKRAEVSLAGRHAELAALHETAVALLDQLDTAKVLELIVGRAGKLVGTEHCYVYTRDPDADDLVVRVGTGAFARNVGNRTPRGEGVAGRVWETRKAFAVPDYHAFAKKRPGFDGAPFHAVAGVPLFARREFVGVLGLALSEPERAFTDEELDLLARFAHLASLALENARLYDAVQASEEQFRTLVTNVPGAIFRCAVDSDWTMEYMTDVVEEITGHPASDFVANAVRTFTSVIHPEDRGLVDETVAASIREGRPYALEYRLFHRDGSERWVLERGQASPGQDGELALDGVLFDITESKHAEAERLELAAIVESSDDAIMSANLAGNFTSWNRGAERMFGYTAEEIIGRSVSVLTPPDRDGEALERMHEVLAGGHVTHYETVRKRKDGTLVDVAFTYSPVRAASGEMIAVSAIAQDIGERKRAEADLRESEAKFRAFVETTVDWVWATDAQAVTTYTNPATERIIGYTPAEILGRNFFELVHEDDREALAEHLRQLAAKRKGWKHLVIRLRHKDGSVRHVQSSGDPILSADGELVGWRGSDRDVTEELAARAERDRLLADAEEARHNLARQNQRLLELDRLKDEFIALVSHELRTPLTSIRGYLELLLEGEAGELNDEQRRFLGVVERNAHRLLHLVGDLLFLAQLEAGRLNLELGATDLGALASEAVEAARPLAEEKNITLTLATGPTPLLAGDHARLGQLFDNLLSNALKFTPSGGRVDVRVRSTKDGAVIEVRDTGLGIPAEEQKHLFERFFRSSIAAEQAIPGTGLGLAITKAIVDAHGGRIVVASDAGKGTTFKVMLPVGQAAAPARGNEEQVAL